MRLLEEGRTPAEIFEALQELDPHFAYRQVGIVSADGTAAGWTGPKARQWHGQIVGSGYVALGNALAGQPVVERMAAVFEAQPELDLHERLLRALEGGRDAGGQKYPDGPTLPERSAVIVVHDQDEYPMLDVRVDVHETALTELRRVRDIYVPLVDYYALRSRDPANTPTHQGWAERVGGTPKRG